MSAPSLLLVIIDSKNFVSHTIAGLKSFDGEMARVFITGAAKRLGALMAERFASCGWSLVLHYNQSEEEVMRLAERFKGSGTQVDLVCADFNVLEQLQDFCFTNPIDLLINNASLFENDNVRSISAEMLEKHMRINLMAPALLIKAFAAQELDTLSDPGIINILDCETSNVPRNFSSYYLSKAALQQLTKMAAKQLAPQIRVNGLALAQVMRNDTQSRRGFDYNMNRYPLQKNISERNFYHALEYLVQNDNVTGEILSLDSGAGL